MQYDPMQIIYEQMLAKYKTYIFSHFNCMKLISRFIRKIGKKTYCCLCYKERSLLNQWNMCYLIFKCLIYTQSNNLKLSKDGGFSPGWESKELLWFTATYCGQIWYDTLKATTPRLKVKAAQTLLM